MTTLPEGIARLETLIEILKNVKSKNFDLNSWANSPDLMKTKKVKKEIKEGVCGTTACACGHAGLYKPFRELGFKLKVYEGGADIVYKTPEGDVLVELDAAAAFFKLTDDEAYRLFDPCHYPIARKSKYYVIKRIETQIKKMRKQQ
jgi:hypothetical protein